MDVVFSMISIRFLILWSIWKHVNSQNRSYTFIHTGGTIGMIQHGEDGNNDGQEEANKVGNQWEGHPVGKWFQPAVHNKISNWPCARGGLSHYNGLGFPQCYTRITFDKGDDAIILTEYFLKRFARKNDKPGLKIGQTTPDVLKVHPWPGKIRELQHAIEHAVILCERSISFPPLIFSCASKKQEYSFINKKMIDCH